MIIVTGAAGFLGSRLTALLRASDVEVIALRRGAKAAANGQEWRANLLDPAHATSLAGTGVRIDTLVHLAGHIDISLVPGPGGKPLPGPENLWNIYAGNLLTTVNALHIARSLKTRHFIFASSQAVYGFPQSIPVMESAACAPLEHYAASKVACEEMLRLAALDSLSVTVLRFPGLYGPLRSSGAVSKFCTDAILRGRIIIDAPVQIPYDVLHVDDAADGVARAIECQATGLRYLNLASGIPCSLEILAQEISALVPGCTVELRGVAQPPVALDSTYANTVLGWHPQPRVERLKQILRGVRAGCRGLT